MNELFMTGAFLLSVFGTPVYASEPIPIPETIEQKIERVAESHKIASTSLYNLAMSESSLGIKRVGDGDKSCGIIHFYEPSYPYEFANCEDDELILNKAAQMIADGEGWKFTPGNCYQFAKALVGKLPRMVDIQPNTTIPRKGEIAIFNYRGQKHIGVQDGAEETGFWIREANYEPFKIGRRFIKWNDPAFVGFHSLGTS
jgi:hypothetical protein